MTTKISAKLERSVSNAASKYASKTSNLHKALAKELKKLGTRHAALLGAFETRRAKRSSAAQAAHAAGIAAAKAEFERVTREQAPLLASGNPHLELIAKNLIEFSKGRIRLTESLARSDTQQAQREDDIDQSFLLWIEELALLSVEAIDSDKARKRAIGIINGGLIVGGLTTLPFAPAISALLAGILLARQWRDAESEETTDSDAVRIERATRLLAHVNTIMKAWLQVVK